MPVAPVESALHDLAREDRAFGDGGNVAEEHLAEAGSKRGSVVADLVSVGKNHEVRVFELDELLQSREGSVRRVGSEQRVLHRDDP